MKIEVNWLIGMLNHLLGGQAEALVRKRMENAQDGIVKAMTAKDLTPEVGVKVLTRDALFRLWKACVRSGDLADLCRDGMDRRVVARLEKKFPFGAGDLNAIVTETMNAALAEVFGE